LFNILEEVFLAEDLLRLQLASPSREKPFSLRLRDRRPILLFGNRISFKGLPCLVLLITENAEQLQFEKELRDHMKQDRERLFKAVRCTLRVYELHEKIRKIPTLTRELLQVGEEEVLYDEAGRILHEEGMDLGEVSFLIVKNGQLEVAYSNREDLQNASFPIDGDTKYAYLFRRGGSAIDPWAGGVFVLPLRGREDLIGLMEVSISEDARRVFSEDHKVSLGIYDALLTIADIIALLVENIRLYRKLKHRSQTDPLTGLYNREYLLSEIKREISRSNRFQRPLSLLFIDVDNLKGLNDELGHLQVDMLLGELGKILRVNSRTTDCICRYGGDEFVILLPETDLPDAQAKGNEVCERVSGYRFPHLANPELAMNLTISCGVATYKPEMSPESFLAGADKALYRAKALGKNQVASLAG
jgi:diguanylate cyclase (GGDEF)-like protein